MNSTLLLWNFRLTCFHSFFWRKLKTPKRHFEINWPLDTMNMEKIKMPKLKKIKVCRTWNFFRVWNRPWFSEMRVQIKRLKVYSVNLKSSLYKGQLILKANCQAVKFSKKRTNKFVFTSIQCVFAWFLEEIEDSKKAFRNYLTFSTECQTEPVVD